MVKFIKKKKAHQEPAQETGVRSGRQKPVADVLDEAPVRSRIAELNAARAQAEQKTAQAEAAKTEAERLRAEAETRAADAVRKLVETEHRAAREIAEERKAREDAEQASAGIHAATRDAQDTVADFKRQLEGEFNRFKSWLDNIAEQVRRRVNGFYTGQPHVEADETGDQARAEEAEETRSPESIVSERFVLDPARDGLYELWAEGRRGSRSGMVLASDGIKNALEGIGVKDTWRDKGANGNTLSILPKKIAEITGVDEDTRTIEIHEEEYIIWKGDSDSAMVLTLEGGHLKIIKDYNSSIRELAMSLKR